MPERPGLVVERFAAGGTLIVLLLTVLDTTHVIATTAGTTYLFVNTTLQTRIPTFLSESRYGSGLRNRGYHKQDEKRKKS